MNPTIEPWIVGLAVFGLLAFMGILVAFSLTIALRSRTELEEIKSRPTGGYAAVDEDHHYNEEGNSRSSRGEAQRSGAHLP